VQHGGIIVGLGNAAGHSHRFFNKESKGYFGRLKTIQNLSAVTGACLMCKKSVYEEVGGFDTNYSHAYNDVDFCLKIRKKGYLIVYTPFAELYHHEYLSRGLDNTREKRKRYRSEVERFRTKWIKIITEGDPYYNPNLTLFKEDFSIRL
jgi:GT2 family glycosyltransferase